MSILPFMKSDLIASVSATYKRGAYDNQQDEQHDNQSKTACSVARHTFTPQQIG